MTDYQITAYRLYNQDLQNLNDSELQLHFKKNGATERRLFDSPIVTSERMSMTHLRGQGVEIGAAVSPTKLFCESSCIYIDLGEKTVFGSSNKPDEILNLDASSIPHYLKNTFDFAIASHVLEHCDSFIRALRNLISMVKEGGIIYLVLPDSKFLQDHLWITPFSLQHHIEEYADACMHVDRHQSDYFDYLQRFTKNKTVNTFDYTVHRHSYTYVQWLRLILQVVDFIDDVELIDCCFGNDRKDCHFIFRTNAKH